MKNAFQKNQKLAKWRKRGLMVLAYTGVFGAAASTAFFATKQQVTTIDMRDSTGGVERTLSKREKLMTNLADSATAGLEISVTDFVFDQYYVDENGFAHQLDENDEEYYEDSGRRYYADESGNAYYMSGETKVYDDPEQPFSAAKTGHNTISSYIDEDGNKAPIEIAFKMDSLSLHGINLSLTAPLTYSDNGKNQKHRGIHASLVDGVDDETLYINLFDNGDTNFLTDEEGDVITERTAKGGWDLKYKVDVSPKELYVFDSTKNGTSYDTVTRGIEYFEYGQLDWILEDILNILSDGAINISFEGWLDKLMGSDNAAETEQNNENQDESNEEEEPSAVPGISVDDIMNSMNTMSDVWTSDPDKGYFLWNIPLGSMNIPLGLQSDENGQLCHVDLPATYNEDGTHVPANTRWKIKDGMELEVHADIKGLVSPNWQSKVYGDPGAYLELANSLDLFEDIAAVAGKPEVKIEADLEIGHSQEAVEGSRTVLRKDAVEEAMTIALEANLDAYDDANHSYAFEGVEADIKIDRKRDSEDFLGHQIKFAYLEEEEDDYGAYINVNDILLAKTSKNYLDEVITQVKESFSESSSGLSLDMSEDDLMDLLDTIGLDISSILRSDLIKAIKTGAYSGLLNFVKEIKNEDNLIYITLGFEPLGGDVTGTMTLSLDARSNSAGLVQIAFNDVQYKSVKIDGTLKVNGLSSEDSIEIPAIPEGKSYQCLSHVKGILGQVKEIVDDKSFEAKIDGRLLDGEEEKLGLNGDVAFDFGHEKEGEEGNEADGQGKVGLHLSHPIANTKQMHNVTLGLQDNFQTVGFEYDSKTDLEGYSSQESDNSIKGMIDLPTAKKALTESNVGFSLDTLVKFLFGDDRFGRLSKALLEQESSSLLGDLLGGKYFALLENQHIISSIDLLSDKTSLVIDGSKLGMEGITIDLDIVYGSADSGLLFDTGDENDNRGIESIDVKVIKDTSYVDEEENLIESSEDKFDLSISGIKPLEDKESAKAFDSFEGFDDYSPIVTLGTELVNTVTMGMRLNNESKVLEGSSNYNVHGDINLNIVGYKTCLYDFDASAHVDGAETKIEADFDDLPVIRGVNGPDDDLYFRRNEAEGIRDSHIYFYGNGIDPEGELLLTRESSYGRVKDVRDAVRVDGKDFTGDFLNWILEYSLGVNESLLNKEEAESEETAEPEVEEEASSSWNPFAKGVHVADAWGGFSVADDEASGKTTYALKVNLGKLLNIGLLGDAEIDLVSRKLTESNETSTYSASCLTGLSIKADAEATAANNGKKMSIAGVEVNIGLDNFGTPNEEGYSEVESVLGEGSDYANLFVGSVADSGVIDSSAKGSLYDLRNGFQLDDMPEAVSEGAEGYEQYLNDLYLYTLYGYNFLGQENVAAGNLYLGIGA